MDLLVNNAFCIKRYQDLPNWDRFVDTHPKGSIFHTSAMIRAESTTKRHSPHAMGVVDGDGNLYAILVAINISTLPGIGARISTRSIMFAEPICLENEAGQTGLKKLLEEHDTQVERKSLFTEIRPCFGSTRANDPILESRYQHLGYLNYELDLRRPESILFSSMSNKRRNNVRSAIRRGVCVKEVELAQNINDIYPLIALSYNRSKVPLVDISLFESVATELGHGRIRVLIAYYDNKPISAGVFLCYRDRVVCWYAGTQRIPGIHSMACLFWEAIRIFSSEGFSIFDLAGAGWEGEDYGPGKFKSKFGGHLTNHGRYRKIYSRWKFIAANTAYQWTRRFQWDPRWASHNRPIVN